MRQGFARNGIKVQAWLILVAALILSGMCHAAPNQFVIVSDIQPSGGGEGGGVPEQVEKLCKEVLEIKPAFVVQLGDVGNDFLDTNYDMDAIDEIKLIDAMFRKWREAGIQIHIAVGNHDVPKSKPGFAAVKRNWFASQLPPYPMNDQLDYDKNPDIWKRYCLEGRQYYSFTWRGIHFIIADTENLDEEQLAWLKRVLCDHEGNPSKYPTLMFVHQPEYMTGARGVDSRPLYRVLEKNPDGHTVKAVFGGHWHCADYSPPEHNLGAHVYVVPGSADGGDYHKEYIVATVSDDLITFERRIIAPGKDGRVFRKFEYHPIPGRFGNLP
ncbi:MAG: metallophosphoesterase [Armatimonadetes bacterium]|nr:metallophosphoesterase [Armatimonadota bacterium]